jgi:pimeloyl-ACP methyl ester carboxylesterase
MSDRIWRAWSRRRIGDYVASETSIEFLPDVRRVAGQVPVVFCHGLLGTAADLRKGKTATQLKAIAEIAETVVLAADLGGVITWGNDTVVLPTTGRIDVLVAKAAVNLSTRTDKVFICGESMGVVNATNWSWRQPTRVAGMWLRAPITRFQETHNRLLDPALGQTGIPATMESAYTNIAGLSAAYPTHDPAVAANLAILASLGSRTRLDATADDVIVPATSPVLYANQTGAELHMHPGDHAANIDTPIEEVAEWVRSMIRANS